MVTIIQNDPRVPAGISSDFCQSQVIRAYDQQPFPDLNDDDAVVILGGTMSFDEDSSYRYLADVKRFMDVVIKRDLPLLGICLGAQMLADVLAGNVYHHKGQEQGLHPVKLTRYGCIDPLFAGFDEQFKAFQWHQDCFDIPHGATQLATSEQCENQAFRYGNSYGVQFHPEVTATIVDDWCQFYGGCNEVSQGFKATSARQQRCQWQLFENFYLNHSH